VRRAGDAPDEMTSTPRPPRAPRARRRSLSEADVATLLRGGSVGDRPELAGLTTFTAEVRALAEQAPVPSAALSAFLAQGFDPAATRAAAASPVSAGPTRSRTARSLLVRLAGVSLVAKIATGTGVAVAVVAGTGVLPDVVQDRVTGIVEAVTPSDEGAPPSPLPAATAAPSVPAGPPTAGPPAVGPPAVVPAPRPTAVPSAARPDGATPPRPELTQRPAQTPSRPGRAPERPPTSRPSPAATPAPPAQSRPGDSPGSASSRPGGQPDSGPPEQSRPDAGPESPFSDTSGRSGATELVPARSDGADTRSDRPDGSPA
jgi:hypothetical protein